MRFSRTAPRVVVELYLGTVLISRDASAVAPYCSCIECPRELLLHQKGTSICFSRLPSEQCANWDRWGNKRVPPVTEAYLRMTRRSPSWRWPTRGGGPARLFRYQ